MGCDGEESNGSFVGLKKEREKTGSEWLGLGATRQYDMKCGAPGRASCRCGVALGGVRHVRQVLGGALT